MNSSNTTSGAKPVGKPIDVDKLVRQYVMLRDRKTEIEAEQKDALKPFNEMMGKIEGLLMEHMHQTGIESIRTPSGTAYQSTTPRATIKDRSAFRQWVVEQGGFDLVDWRANAREVADFIKVNNSPPPGINFSTFTAVRFRRPGEEE